MSELAATTPASAPVAREMRVRDAIADASRKTSVDFDYLLAQARVESSLDNGAKAQTSSAAGLFQFIESTWLATLHRHGSKLGLGDAASKIRMTASGPQVFDPSARAEVLALRHDPQAASLMAGALAQDNRAALLSVLGREPETSELYLAHFLGAGGATRFLKNLQADPNASAAALLPRPAAANLAMFFTETGRHRSLGDVMGIIEGKMSRAMRANDASPAALVGSASEPHIATRPTLPVARRRSDWPGSAAVHSDMRLPSLPSRSRASPQPMSNILRASFDTQARHTDVSRAAPSGDHVRQAYAKLKAFGL